LSKVERTLVALHLTFPMPQKLLNLIKECGRYGVFDVKGLKLKQIKISSLKSLIIASLPLEYTKVL
jgi:hypothetical protein